MLNLKKFTDEFLEKTNGWTWEVEGFIDTRGYVHPIDTDTKVISTVFERISSPVIRSIAKGHGYIVETANQTTYPDFTLSHFENHQLTHRIAVDIKTTYLSDSMLFTLGGYNSFLRNDTKNILYPYSTYQEHWIIGFVYAQNPKFNEYDMDNMPKKGQIPCPYSNVTFFIREKHAIAGIRAGSGNTKNIGSVKVTDPKQFATVKGPFLQFKEAKKACDLYWRNYEKYSSQIFSTNDLINHGDFAAFK